MKLIAMYLPQYHRIRENDEWWGDGYTEWTAVRAAFPYFSGQNQPIVPLNENYYDLTEKSTMEWQANLAKQYHIDGFCFYHYWFGRDRTVLEKPAENLLRWKDIDMPFCFSWDSGSWARTWTKIGNSWADKFERPRSSNDKGILIEQDLGGKEFWKAHFEYLLPFFKDPRYIRVNHCPVFVFYGSFEMPCFEHMCLYWRNLAQEAGLPGLYIIAMSQPSPAADAVVLPMSFRKQTMGYNLESASVIPETSILGYDYDRVWNDYLNFLPLQGQKTLWQCTVNYDDTPRRGQNGRVYLGGSTEKFKRYFRKLYRKSKAQENPFLFVDAWNEWGEGKYLEPDTRTEYGYLEAIREVANEHSKIENELIYELPKEIAAYVGRLENQTMRYQRGYFFLLSWLRMHHPSKAVQQYFEDQGISSIAIYGFGLHGHIFWALMKNTNIPVVYAIDRQARGMSEQEALPVYSLDNELPSCDAIVISLVNDYVSVVDSLRGKFQGEIFSIFEVISGALNKDGNEL